jgi:uncharacterized protein (TIRG00374 family)
MLAVASVFLVWILHKVGWGTLWSHLQQVGWYFPLLLMPYGLVNWLEAMSWKYLLLDPLPGALPLRRLFWLRLGGEALNQLTPTASLGGEPFKITGLLANGLGWEVAAASVVIHKAILVLSLALYVIMGLAMAPLLLPVAGGQLAFLSLGALFLAASGVFLVVGQRLGFLSQGIRLVCRSGWCPARLKEKETFFTDLDQRLADFYRQHPGRAALAFVIFFLSWVLHAVEVYVMFWLLGHPISWPLAICLDALAMLFTAMGFFIPAAIGIQEGGNLLLALGFDLGLGLGAAFSILRRLREAFWLTLGLVAVAREK